MTVDNTPKDYITYQYRIYPTDAQATQLQKQFGCVRFVYNHFLYYSFVNYRETGKHRSYNENAKDLTMLKKMDEFHWLREVHSQPLQQALMDLREAFGNFFAGRAKLPRFKQKRGWKKFRFPQGVKLDEDEEQTYLPKIGWVKTVFHRQLPDAVLKSVTVGQSPGGRYTISCLYEREMPKVTYTGGEIGIDMGLTHLAITSDGEKIANPRHLQKSMQRVKKLSKDLSRKQIGSAGWHKARRRLAKLHEKIRNQRHDYLHRLSYRWTHENQVIRLETLNVKGMVKNRRLAQSISSVAWSELKRQLEYKGRWYGCEIEYAPPFFPSSQLCHACRHKNSDLSLSDRQWQCPDCGVTHDRDINAALNIRDYHNFPTAGAVGS